MVLFVGHAVLENSMCRKQCPEEYLTMHYRQIFFRRLWYCLGDMRYWNRRKEWFTIVFSFLMNWIFYF